MLIKGEALNRYLNYLLCTTKSFLNLILFPLMTILIWKDELIVNFH